jgi:hypothetical protein
VSIWQKDREPNYNMSKRDLSFSTWRVLVMERTGQLLKSNDNIGAERMLSYGTGKLGQDYEDNVTAEDMAVRLAR